MVRELGSVCGSTAMIVTMHYAAVAALTAAGDKETLSAIAGGSHLSTLAFSERGSRSHFWAPVSTAALTTGPDGPTARGPDPPGPVAPVVRRCGSTRTRAGSPRRGTRTATCGRAGRSTRTPPGR